MRAAQRVCALQEVSKQLTGKAKSFVKRMFSMNFGSSLAYAAAA
jgi:hypothetical protein